MKNIIFLGRKPMAYEAIKYLFSLGFSLKYIILENPEYCYGTPVNDNDTDIYQLIAKKDKNINDIDLVVSFLYWKKIKKPLIDLAKFGCVNFHPAPLPDYKGRAGYNTAILDGKKYFGVSAHYIDSEQLDTGPIIKVIKFKIDPDKENAHSLEAKTQKKLFELFKYIIDTTNKKTKFTVSKNSGGTYLSTPQLESLKLVDLKNDSPDIINRKIRAFFFPPYSGAKIEVKGQEYTLINEEILRYIKKQ